MMRKKQARFLSFTTLSVLLHLFFFGGVILLENTLFMNELNKLLNHTVIDKTKDVVTQIELIDLEEEMKQVVQQSDQSVDETEPEDADFLSKRNQNVEKETKSALNGKFNNASNIPEGASANQQAQKEAQAIPPSKSTPKPTQAKKAQAPQKAQASATPPSPKTPTPSEEAKNFGLNGLRPLFNPTQALNKQFNKPQEEKSLQRAQDLVEQAMNQASPQNPSKNQRAVAAGGDGISQTDDYLEDIEIGDQTLLKTKEYKYYSFYSRVREQLRSNWNPLIREKVSFLYSTGRGRELATSTPTKKTSLRVTLNEQGYLESIELLKTSGVTTLDRAAIDAFRNAAPFPNPPKGMREKDKKVRIFWDFVLET